MKELGILVAHQREHADQHRHRQVLDAPQHRLEQVRLEDRLRHDELRAGLPLLLEAGELLVEIRRARLEARREEERRLAAGQRLAGGIHATVHVRRHLQQPDRVEVVDRGRLRVVADLRRVARDDY